MKVKAILIVTIMVLSILPYTPEATLKSNIEPSFQASNADVAVTQLDITTPSVYVGAVPTVSPMNHIIRVTIVNFGGSDAEGTLTLEVDDGSGPSESRQSGYFNFFWLDIKSYNVLECNQFTLGLFFNCLMDK